VIQAMTILELLGRYPCGDDADAQWCGDDLLEILQWKRDLLRMSLVVHEIAGEPSRRLLALFPVPVTGSLWSTLATYATYATELAPIAGPLLESIARNATAIERADRRCRVIDADWVEE
jgi:hypothetical protein